MMYSEESLLPLSGIQHYAFCPRQWALIHLEEQWRENLFTAEGKLLHERVHAGPDSEWHGEFIVARSLQVVSYSLGLFGVADIVEFHRTEDRGITIKGLEGQWQPHPVEYKRGKPKPDDRDEVQLCAQAMCLEETLGIKVPSGSFFYGKIRRRYKITFTESLRTRVIQLASQMHESFLRGRTPPARSGANCKLCSLQDLCLPKLTKERKSAKAYTLRELANLD